jgi:hypothetical protein
MSYGFIVTRHVNSEKTNRYWNRSIKQIKMFYPLKKIVIIDDNSDYNFVSETHGCQNIEIIQSEYPKRGELLPYIYFLKYKWFDNAVILHDSVFIHKRIPFEILKCNVMPLWHHTYDKENLNNLLRIGSVLKNSLLIKKKLQGSTINILGFHNDNRFNLCFGVQSYINLNFLETLEKKYKITNLVSVINSRIDRCGLERIMGLLFCIENPNLIKIGSLFGRIHKHHKSFKYSFDQYLEDIKKKYVPEKFVKVWTGR